MQSAQAQTKVSLAVVFNGKSPCPTGTQRLKNILYQYTSKHHLRALKLRVHAIMTTECQTTKNLRVRYSQFMEIKIKTYTFLNSAFTQCINILPRVWFVFHLRDRFLMNSVFPY